MLYSRPHNKKRSFTSRKIQARRRQLLRVERLEDRRLLAVFNVNSFLDSVDANPGDGQAQDTLGRTTLRAAIMEANARPGADTVNLPSGTYVLTVNGIREDAARSGDLDIRDSISIIGANAASTIIDASGLSTRDRVLHVPLGGSLENPIVVELRSLTVTGGYALGAGDSDWQDRGGGAFLEYYSEVTLVDTVWKGNTAPRAVSNSAWGTGGAISSAAKLTILDSRFEGNSASNSGGALYVGTNTASTVVRNSTFDSNSANGGGAIQSHRPMTIDSSTFSRNQGGSLAAGNGGAINNQQDTLIITNSTISDNLSAFGGGIINFGTLRVSSSTIVNNTGGWGGGIDGNVVIENSIVAKNTSTFSGPDVRGAATSLGFNLIGNTSGSSGFGTNDLLNVDPLIGPLASNGGLTQTHALLAGSPAINAARAATSPPKDQRVIARPQGIAPDIGAHALYGLAASLCTHCMAMCRKNPLSARLSCLHTACRVI